MVIESKDFEYGNDCLFHCAMVGGAVTLSACQKLCPKVSRCDTAARGDDILCYAYEDFYDKPCDDSIQVVMLRRASSPHADYEVERIEQSNKIFNMK